MAGRKLDEHVHVAPGGEVLPEDGAEECQTDDVAPPAEVRKRVVVHVKPERHDALRLGSIAGPGAVRKPPRTEVARRPSAVEGGGTSLCARAFSAHLLCRK